MSLLKITDLYSLEHYASIRSDFRARVIAHKKNRTIAIGPSATLQFEDRLTMQYQVQEMLRAERLYLPEEIQGELDAYNPLISEGNQWKATFFIEVTDAEKRKIALEEWAGIEHFLWVQVAGFDRVFAVSDEDMPRGDSEKTSAVHFSSFTLDPKMLESVHAGAEISIGIDHPKYQHSLCPVPTNIQKSLARMLFD